MSHEVLREERTQRYDLQTLYDASRLLNDSLDLDYVLRNLVLSIMSKLLVTRSVVLLYESIEQAWRVAVTRGVPTLSISSLIKIPQDSDKGIWTGEQIHPVLSDHGITMVIPVQTSGRHIGLVGLGPKVTREPFNEAEMEYVQALVHMSGTAIHNSLMITELRQANQDLDNRVQQLRTLFELSKEFNATVDRERVVKLFTFTLLGQMAALRHVLHLRRSDGRFGVVAAQGPQPVDMRAAFLDELDELVLVDAENRDQYPELVQHGFVLALPIRVQGQVQGILCMGPKWSNAPYKQEEIEFLYSLGSLVVISIHNADLIEERIEKQRLEEELRMAKGIQERLLPGRIPQNSRLEIATLALPSREVGGDYFDVLQLTGDRLLIAVADVTGKGMPAALLMSTIHACTHLMVPMRLSLAESIEETNRVVYDNTDADKFITVFAAIYYPDGMLEYVNAGHEQPLLVRRDGTVERLGIGGPLLGVVSGIQYASEHVKLNHGDLVVLFTDGVTEAMGAAMEEYTESRLQALVLAHRHRKAASLVQRIQEDIESFTGPVEARSDDRTLLVLKACE